MLNEADTSGAELVAALDEKGKPLLLPVTRRDAHRLGIWHRTVSIFVLNTLGEVLIERRSENKDLFPGFYDVVGGHLHPGERSSDGACKEIYEELRLDIPPARLELLAPEDSVIERVVLTDHGIINLERKSVYLLRINSDEEEKILKLAAGLRRLAPYELEARGTSGEVSQIEFWSWERLTGLADSKTHRPIASGTLSALNDISIRDAMARSCHLLRDDRRREFATRYAFLSETMSMDRAYDQELYEQFLPRPRAAASADDVKSIFEDGSNELAGAYEMGRFRLSAAGDEFWGPKLSDSETRYVRNLLHSIGAGQVGHVWQMLDNAVPNVQTFVGAVLNYPLANGARFRDNLGNLTDIAAGRQAVIAWLKYNVPDLAGAGVLERPTGQITALCLHASRDLLTGFLRANPISRLNALRDLILLGLGASATDFNNPAFQVHLRHRPVTARQISYFIGQSATSELSRELGGDHFLSEFHTRFVESGKPVRIAYLSGNAAQAYIGLAVIQEILQRNGQAKISLIPKGGSPGNDLTYDDARRIITEGSAGVFRDLSHYRGEGRFTIEPDGPDCHGLDPGRLSTGVARVLSRADVIVAEGQAYAEIRGWKKPVYIAFRVNGRVAEAIHGAPRGSGGFVRLTPGVSHFRGFIAAVQSSFNPKRREKSFVAAQTTAGYVRAILSENFDLIAKHLFQNDHLETCRQIRAECERLNKTFTNVIMGAASQPPDSSDVSKNLDANYFPVFACGGGGGFSAVTLRALRQLGLPTVAGVPSTDDGGSTGDLQRWLNSERGFVFGVGDMAALLQDAMPDQGKRALLAYRFDSDPESLVSATMERIVAEIMAPTDPSEPIGSSKDFLSFICDQLNFARVIDSTFRGETRTNRLPVKGASIRNLNVIAAYELCGILGDRDVINDESRLAAFFVLKQALGLPNDLMVLPVTYSQSILYLDYKDAIPSELARRFAIPEEALANDRCRLYGQQYIDKLQHSGPRVSVGVVRARQDLRRPSANPAYLTRLRDAQLFVMGAGSLVGSQLSQFVIPGVVDVLLERIDMRRVLILNHVKMDETLQMTVADQVHLIETVAAENASPDLLRKYCANRTLRISDVFTDIVVPRTIARELEAEMIDHQYTTSKDLEVPPRFVDVTDPLTNHSVHVFCNRYVKFLIDYPAIREQYGVTLREIEVLSYLDQPPTLYGSRTEKGRYRGALFATTDDIDYLVAHGIQRRSIHEVDSVGMNRKFVKSEGAPGVEIFPGLVPEALGGIFRIALERSGAATRDR